MRRDAHPAAREPVGQLTGEGDLEVQAFEQLGLREHVFRRALKRYAPAVEHHHAVCLRGLFHKVGDHDDGHARAVEIAAHFEQAMAPARVEHRGGLVQDEHLGAHGEDAGDGHALLLPAGERMGLVVLKAHEAHVCQRLFHA